MCCDGVLFHSVELQQEDSPRQLSSLGLKLRKKKGVTFFLQPCLAHREEGGSCSCSIYEERPSRCRTFQCRQILAVGSGDASEAEARKMIDTAKAMVSDVEQLIDQLAETNPNRSLSHRCANALTTAERTPLHERLESSMKELEAFLEKEFRVA
jgi:Fe-S-cluster containining protein